jgi:arylsulfotransferase ASST
MAAVGHCRNEVGPAGQSSAAQICPAPAPEHITGPAKTADTALAYGLGAFLGPGQAPFEGSVLGLNLSGQLGYGYCPSQPILWTRLTSQNTLMVLIYVYPDSIAEELTPTGALVNSIDLNAANAQLAALGQQQVLDFNHEFIRLPNGYSAVISHNEALYTNVQGGTPEKPVDILGDEVLILDTDWNIVWTWNAFDWLPVSREAVLDEKCTPQKNNGLCPIKLAKIANDWLHANSLYYDATDGNIVVSLRNQDWAVKIAYQNGTGDGHVVWTLGNEGNFTMLNTPNIPSPWFSHQHDVEFATTGKDRMLTLFDNGNTRRATDPTAQSRGQELSVNEATLTVDISQSEDMGSYSSSYGTAQLLPNGNLWYTSGYISTPSAAGGFSTRAVEVVPQANATGKLVYAVTYPQSTYRIFREPTVP